MPAVPSDQFWAKLRNEERLWHPLVAHSADVAAVAGRLVAPDSVLFQRLVRSAGGRTSPDRIRALLVLLAGLHDVGKANHGFQERRFVALRDRAFPHQGHVRIVFESLTDPEFQEALESPFRWADPDEGETLMNLLAATIAHHGRPYDPADVASGAIDMKRYWNSDPASGRAPLDEVRRLGGLAVEWSGIRAHGEGMRLPRSALFNHLVAGFVNLADWVGSTEQFFPLTPDPDLDPAQYWALAQQRADRACRDIGLMINRRVTSLAPSTIYGQLFPGVFGPDTGNRPTPLQKILAERALPEGGSCLVVESDTGSGKTEAALTLYARLREAGLVGGLLFALPTRATASAMKERVAECVKHLYPDGAPRVVLAIGGQSPTPGEAAAILQGAERTYPDGENQKRPDWASGHAKKFLAGEIVVGTIDQALLSVLAVKHANLRLSALSRHFIVVDEVHSHDRYMLETLRTLLRVHEESGGAALLMSATLSATALTFLGEAEGVAEFDEAASRPYPVISDRMEGGGWQDQALTSTGRMKEASWYLVDEAAGLEEAVQAARSGARVCLLRNTVRKARAAMRELLEGGASDVIWTPVPGQSPATYHSKFAQPDREVLDRAVLRDFGSTDRQAAGRPGGAGLILIATQVVEQSLDVDFDLMITDLAPVDVLLQRMGRLHRHPRRNPSRPKGFTQPQLQVIAPKNGIDPTGRSGRAYGWGSVYQNLPVLELTRRIVGTVEHVQIPRDNRFLIESVYHPDRLELFTSDAWAKAMEQTLGRRWAHVSLAKDAVLDFSRTYPDNASRYREERSIRTRLGDDTIRVQVDPPARCWFADDCFAPYVDLPVAILEREGMSLSDPVINGGETDAEGLTRYPLERSVLSYGPQGWEVTREKAGTATVPVPAS